MTRKTILVTGASRGLGAAMARIAASNGAAVVISARSEEALYGVAADIEQGGGEVLVAGGDVSSQDDCKTVVEKTMARFGRLDALINNAGILEPISTIATTDLEQVEYSLAVNVMGPFMLIQVAIPHLRQTNGRVINVSSGAATRGIPGWAAYCAAKAALNQITRVLAQEEPDITAVAVRPGVVDTEMQTLIRTEGRVGMGQMEHQRFVDLHNEGKLVPPDVSAQALVALALHAPPQWSGEFLSWDDEKVRVLLEK